MKRAAGASRLHLGLPDPRRPEGALGVDVDEGAESRPERLDPGEAGLRDLHRRDLAGADPRGQGGERLVSHAGGSGGAGSRRSGLGAPASRAALKPDGSSARPRSAAARSIAAASSASAPWQGAVRFGRQRQARVSRSEGRGHGRRGDAIMALPPDAHRVPESARRQAARGEAHPGRAPVSCRLPAPPDGVHARLAHAPGRTLPAGVPRDPGADRVPRALPDAGRGGRGDAAPGGEARRGRGHPLRRHPAPGRAAGRGPRVLPRGRARHPPPGALGGRRRAAGRARPGGDGALRLRDRAPGARRARGACAADRLRRGAVHRRVLPGGGRGLARLPRDEAAHVRRSRGLARAPHASRPDDRALPERADRRRRPGRPALRLLGRRARAGRLSRPSPCRTRAPILRVAHARACP